MTRLQQARALAATVPDPELPMLTIADLGILRGVTESPDGAIEVTITPTYSGCPAMDMIALTLRDTLISAGLAPVHIRTTLAPAWTTDWITETGRQKLAEAGIAPPTRTPPSCPLCASTDTELLSAFGSTACKSLWRCRTCREPFDHFKCH